MVLSELRQLPASSRCIYSPRMCSLDSSHAAAAACIHAMQYSTLNLSSVIYSSGVNSLWCVLWPRSRATHTGITTLLTCSNLGGDLPPFDLDQLLLQRLFSLAACLRVLQLLALRRLACRHLAHLALLKQFLQCLHYLTVPLVV